MLETHIYLAPDVARSVWELDFVHGYPETSFRASNGRVHADLRFSTLTAQPQGAFGSGPREYDT